MLNLDDNSSTFQVRAFQPGTIRVNERIFTRSIIISSHQLIEDWQPQHISELKPEHLTQLLSFEPKPTILLIGTGAFLQFPAIETYGELINHGIGVEMMDTGAACRTFNALSSENRKVVAALIIR
jgi:uncharacterized protein